MKVTESELYAKHIKRLFSSKWNIVFLFSCPTLIVVQKRICQSMAITNGF